MDHRFLSLSKQQGFWRMPVDVRNPRSGSSAQDAAEARDDSRLAISPPSIADAVYARIRTDILGGLLPPGMKLKPEALRGRYDVSINTLRETLARLAADGLVQAEGDHDERSRN